MAEELIDFVANSDLARGTLRGYGLFITTDRIIGVKRDWQQMSDAILQIMGRWTATHPYDEFPDCRVLPTDEITKVIEQLEQKKDFEVRKEELKEVRIQRKEGWLKRMFTWWGDLTITTLKEAYAIRVIDGDTGKALKHIFTGFEKGKFIAEDK